MAVTITAPQSGYFDRTGAITVSWTNSITSPPQTAYEIMYKLKTASSWSTLGRVTSTATSANLKPIYDAVSQDAVEFYYKVVVYHDLATLSSGNKEGGVEHSAVYSIMFHGSQIATLKVQETASSTQTYPLFNGSTTPTAKLNVRATSSATGTAPLVASGHPLAGKGKVITASGYTAFIGGSSPTFAASGQNRYGYFYGYRYQYSLSYYNRANYAYDRFTEVFLDNRVLSYNNYTFYTSAMYTQGGSIRSTDSGFAYSYVGLLQYFYNVYRYYTRTEAYNRLDYYNEFAYNTVNYSYYNRANYTHQLYAYRAGGTYTTGSYRRLNTSYPVWYYARPLISYRTSYTYYYRVYLYSTYYRYTYYWYTAYYNVPGGGRAGRTFYRYAYGRRDFYGNSSAQTGYTTRYYYTTQTFYYISYSYSTVYYWYWPNSYSYYDYISSYTRTAYVSSYTRWYTRRQYYHYFPYTYYPAYLAWLERVDVNYPEATIYHSYSSDRVYLTIIGPVSGRLAYYSYTTAHFRSEWGLIGGWANVSGYRAYGTIGGYKYYRLWYAVSTSGYQYNNIYYRYNTYYRTYYRNYYQYISGYTPTYWYTNNLSYNYQYYTR